MKNKQPNVMKTSTPESNRVCVSVSYRVIGLFLFSMFIISSVATNFVIVLTSTV